MCSSAPDMSGANAAALEQANLSKEQLDWVKQTYADTQPQRDATQALQNQVSQAQLGLMGQQQDLTTKSNQEYETTFRPIEQQLATEAQSYDTPDRENAKAADAQAAVQAQADTQAANLARTQASMGIDPSSGNAIAAGRGAGVATAAAEAAAGNTARNLVQTTGHAYMADAANLGRGIASSQGTTASLALNAGNSASGTSAAANATGTSGVGMVQQGYSTGINGVGGASANMAGIADATAKTANANSAGMGAAIGGIAMAI